ncbi:hypothetical protein SAY87_008720 [Trapa incisa]|uniref:Uncharacterized protein n=1 Tax=Trapa incisa TaxID=236973 RepID=A0AAN7JUT0_9MYRT|nr:hypothetical protein SAY87_008720 [Trapa incisa]
MAESERVNFEELPNLPDEPWDWVEISLNLLSPLRNHSEESQRKRHRLRWMMKPRAVPQLILKLQEHREKESALRMLSSYLYEKRQEDRTNYYRTGLLLYHSFGTMTILIQELILVYRMMIHGHLTERAAMRLINVIILWQCIAANSKTRQEIVKCRMVNLLEPLVMFQSPFKVYDNVRAVVLSVFGIICQGREPNIIQWAIESNILDICCFSMETGNELNIVIGLNILESILREKLGMSWFLSSTCNIMRGKLLKMWENLVKVLAMHRCYWPRLLFHIIRCYILMCSDSRGHDIVRESLPHPLVDGTFCEILEEHCPLPEYRVIWRLLRQLLLIVGKEHSVNCTFCQRSFANTIVQKNK